ncbi:MAG: T9SS type A sorting domain-containing protein [Prevotella sp.]|jgi:hypothetical protein|nr:T9SS type A sorting domain-containing protein [Prevotella sp.]
MNKRIFTIILAAAMAFAVPLVETASAAVEIIEQDFQGVFISVNQSTIRVTGANGQQLQVYNVAGVRIMSFKVEGNDKTYDLNLSKGCYIIKVGKVVRKVSIK